MTRGRLSVETATRRELGGLARTAAGVVALNAARRLDQIGDDVSGATWSQMVKAHGWALDRALSVRTSGEVSGGDQDDDVAGIVGAGPTVGDPA